MDGLEPSTLYARAGHACPEPNLAIAWPALNRHSIGCTGRHLPPMRNSRLTRFIAIIDEQRTDRSEIGLARKPFLRQECPQKIQSGHSILRNARVVCPIPCFLPPVVVPACNDVWTVVNRRIAVWIAVIRAAIGVIAAPVEVRAARIKPLRQPRRFLRAHRRDRQRGSRWKSTRASAGIQTPGPGEAAEAAVPAATPAPAPTAQPTPRPTAQPMMVPSIAAANSVADRMTGLIRPLHLELIGIEEGSSARPGPAR